MRWDAPRQAGSIGEVDTLSSRALAAAVAVAEAHGLRRVEPEVLKDASNLLVHLRPAPVVARVATTTALIRSDVANWLARELALASHLVSRGAPAAPPSAELPPGPHLRDGLAVSFWTHLPHDPSRMPSPEEVGRSLADLHRASRDFPDELPEQGPLDDVDGALAVLERAGRLADDDLGLLREHRDRMAETLHTSGPAQPLHGDAHPGNLLLTPDGPVWNDFEDTWRGPVAWDLACLAETPKLDGPAAVAGYRPAEAAEGTGPDTDVVDRFRAARRVLGTVWLQVVATRFPERREFADNWLRDWRASVAG
jgi:aminoglycoside phosphotransferase (APT) family kinase protein